jgi:hypothetical protein
MTSNSALVSFFPSLLICLPLSTRPCFSLLIPRERRRMRKKQGNNEMKDRTEEKSMTEQEDKSEGQHKKQTHIP